MKWIVSFLKRGLGKTSEESSKLPFIYEDTVKLDTREIKESKSLGAEVAEWMDEQDGKQEATTSDMGGQDYEDTVPDLQILNEDGTIARPEDNNGYDPYDSNENKKD